MHTIYIEHPDGGYMQNLPSGRLAMCDIDTMPAKHADKILMLLAGWDGENMFILQGIGMLCWAVQIFVVDSETITKEAKTFRIEE